MMVLYSTALINFKMKKYLLGMEMNMMSNPQKGFLKEIHTLCVFKYCFVSSF